MQEGARSGAEEHGTALASARPREAGPTLQPAAEGQVQAERNGWGVPPKALLRGLAPPSKGLSKHPRVWEGPKDPCRMHDQEEAKHTIPG